jgi:Co/Zn/Cd efflux system component
MVPHAATDVGQLTSAVGILSAMITPAILILASGSILATTSTRLGRVVDRVRALSAEIQALGPEDTDNLRDRSRRELLFILLRSATMRARILQRAMTQLYLAVATFILTSVVIGVLSLTALNVAWLSLVFGLFGAVLLLSASVFLIIESRKALASTRAETEFVWKWSAQHLSGSKRG